VNTRSEVVCGVDLGSTNTKVVGVDAAGRVVFRTSAPTPRGADGLLRAAELLATIEDMLLRLAAAGHLIVAACCAGVGEDGLLISDHHEALCDILPWYHPARDATFREVAVELDDDPRLPVPTDAARTIVGWRWARRQVAGVRARSWVALTDWPAVSWTGRTFMSDTLAARTAAWSPWGGGWMPDRIAVTLGDVGAVPEVLPTGEVVGPLRSATLSAAGALAPDAVVVAGGHDHPIGAWAVQQLSSRAVVDSMGTAEVVVTQAPHRPILRSTVFDVGPGVLGSGTTVLAVQELARNVEWASRDPEVAQEIRRLLAGTVRPTDDLLDEVFVPGWPGGLEPSYTREAPTAPLARASAVLGSLSRRGEERVQAVAGTLDAEPYLYATGGWARSAGWMALKESISGRTFRSIAEPEVTAVAAALLAARTVGWDLAAEQLLHEASLR
jgi:sugar (pentulose or hexulose) kinase